MLTAAETQVQHRRPEDQYGEMPAQAGDGALAGVGQKEGRDGDQEGEAVQVQVFAAVENLDVRRAGAFQIVGTRITHFQQQGGRFLLDECKDRAVHPGRGGLDLPAHAAVQDVESPEPFVVALGGHHGRSAGQGGEAARQVIGAADVAGNHRHDELAGTVDADYRRILVFVFQRGSDAADADAHGTDENHGLEILPVFFQKRGIRPDGGAAGDFVLRIDDGAPLLWFIVPVHIASDALCKIQRGFGDEDDGGMFHGGFIRL